MKPTVAAGTDTSCKLSFSCNYSSRNDCWLEFRRLLLGSVLRANKYERRRKEDEREREREMDSEEAAAASVAAILGVAQHEPTEEMKTEVFYKMLLLLMRLL